jgi:O-antigen/teichoic acid export membrane protein
VSQIYNSNKLFSGNVVARNTLYNLLGYGIPLIFAILLIPMLVKGLGEEKFGILNLAWVVIGYFSFLDFGIGKSLTKIIAEKIGLEQYFQIPGFFWTSIIVMFVISLIVTILLIIITPVLINDVLKISDNLKPEAINTFYALSLSIPLVTTTAGLRGFLEAYQKFGMINIFRTFLGIFTFAMPVLVLIFTNNLLLIIISLVLIRIIVWVMYFIECLKTNHQIRKEFRISFELMKQVLKLSGWITVSNIVGPLFIYLDRFFIGAIITVAAITYYATPFEVITKLLLIPGALVAVLFPMFSQSYYKNPQYSKTLFKKGVKFIYLFLYPIILLIMTFAYEAMNAWMGLEFADNSSLILQLLSFGVLLNSLAYIPFHYLQGIGKPDIPAKINLLELPFYLLAAWFL